MSIILITYLTIFLAFARQAYADPPTCKMAFVAPSPPGFDYTFYPQALGTRPYYFNGSEPLAVMFRSNVFGWPLFNGTSESLFMSLPINDSAPAVVDGAYAGHEITITNFSMTADAWIRVPKSGNYTFVIQSDYIALMTISNNASSLCATSPFLDTDDVKFFITTVDRSSGTVYLDAGIPYRMAVLYVHPRKSIYLRVSVIDADGVYHPDASYLFTQLLLGWPFGQYSLPYPYGPVNKYVLFNETSATPWTGTSTSFISVTSSGTMGDDGTLTVTSTYYMATPTTESSTTSETSSESSITSSSEPSITSSSVSSSSDLSSLEESSTANSSTSIEISSVDIGEYSLVSSFSTLNSSTYTTMSSSDDGESISPRTLSEDNLSSSLSSPESSNSASSLVYNSTVINSDVSSTTGDESSMVTSSSSSVSSSIQPVISSSSVVSSSSSSPSSSANSTTPISSGSVTSSESSMVVTFSVSSALFANSSVASISSSEGVFSSISARVITSQASSKDTISSKIASSVQPSSGLISPSGGNPLQSESHAIAPTNSEWNLESLGKGLPSTVSSSVVSVDDSDLAGAGRSKGSQSSSMAVSVVSSTKQDSQESGFSGAAVSQNSEGSNLKVSTITTITAPSTTYTALIFECPSCAEGKVTSTLENSGVNYNSFEVSGTRSGLVDEDGEYATYTDIIPVEPKGVPPFGIEISTPYTSVEIAPTSITGEAPAITHSVDAFANDAITRANNRIFALAIVLLSVLI